MHRSTQLFLVALATWSVVALIAAQTAAHRPVAGLALGLTGGVVFGFVAAHRVDPHRVRVRVGKHRRRHPEENDTA